MRLIIVRHGETEANLGRVIQGHSANSLSARGKLQAEQLAERLSQESIEYIYSSDLTRAKETAALILQRVAAPVQYSSTLRERCYGEFEGKTVAEYEQALKDSGEPRHTYQPPRGESLLQLEERVNDFLTGLADKHGEATVLTVAHAGTNRMLLKVLLNKTYEDWLQIEQDNACVNIVEVPSPNFQHSHLLNCTIHLQSVGVSRLGVHE